jgi:Spindle and kinetochore-associated protein 1
MAAETNELVHSFTHLVRTLDAENREATRMLCLAPVIQAAAAAAATKSGTAAQTSAVQPSAADCKVLSDLQSLTAVVDELERRTQNLRQSIDEQRSTADSLESMLQQAHAQSAELEHMTAHLPKHLPGDAQARAPACEPPTDKRATTSQSVSAAAARAAMPVVKLVTAAELDSVPKTTRGRVQLEQINAAIAELQVDYLTYSSSYQYTA